MLGLLRSTISHLRDYVSDRRTGLAEFRAKLDENLEACRWRPHELYSVFTQYDKEHYLKQKGSFILKYQVFYSVSKTVSPKRIIELGTHAGSGADAYLSATPSAEYHGFDLFNLSGEVKNPDGSPWQPLEVAKKLFKARGFSNYHFHPCNLRELNGLPVKADFVVVDGGHDFTNQYGDMKLALTADPDWIWVDDAAPGEEGHEAIEKFLREDVRGRVAWALPLDYVGGGLLIKLSPARRRLARPYRPRYPATSPRVPDYRPEAPR